MGYDVYACAVVGVRHEPGVIKERLYRVIEEKEECPTCGAQSRTKLKVLVPIPAYEETAEEPRLCGYCLVNRGEGYYDDPEFIAFWCTKSIGSRDTVSERIDEFAWEDIRNSMRGKLEPLGLWSEEGFGLHVFLQESC